MEGFVHRHRAPVVERGSWRLGSDARAEKIKAEPVA